MCVADNYRVVFSFRDKVRQLGDIYIEVTDFDFNKFTPNQKKIMIKLLDFKNLDFDELVKLYIQINCEMSLDQIKEFWFKFRNQQKEKYDNSK